MDIKINLECKIKMKINRMEEVNENNQGIIHSTKRMNMTRVKSIKLTTLGLYSDSVY